MVHELLIPLVDELSLSVAADSSSFRGRCDDQSLGTSMLLRIG